MRRLREWIARRLMRLIVRIDPRVDTFAYYELLNKARMQQQFVQDVGNYISGKTKHNPFTDPEHLYVVLGYDFDKSIYPHCTEQPPLNYPVEYTQIHIRDIVVHIHLASPTLHIKGHAALVHAATVAVNKYLEEYAE